MTSGPGRSTHPSARAGLLAAVLLVASAGGGFVLYRLTVSSRPTLYAEPASARTVVGQGPHAPAVPEELPRITLPDLDGKVRALSDWSGRPLLINFWATWCEPCRREVPLLRALRRKQAVLHLEVVGIAIDSSDAVRQYVASHGIDYPVLIGEKDGLAAITAFGMDSGLPFSVFSDRSGRVVALKVGELHADEADLILDRLQQLDTGRLTLAAARTQIADGVRLLGRQHAAAGAPGASGGS